MKQGSHLGSHYIVVGGRGWVGHGEEEGMEPGQS